MSVSVEKSLDVLIKEYGNIAEWIRALDSRWFRVLAFMTPVISALFIAGFRFDVQAAFLLVPLLVFVYESIETSVRLTMVNAGVFLELIEKRINAVAEEELLTWENRFTSPRLYRDLILRSPSRNFMLINPFYYQGLMIGFLEVALVVVSTIRGFQYLSLSQPVWAWLFVVTSGLLLIITGYFFIISMFVAPEYSRAHMKEFFDEKIKKTKINGSG